MDQDNLNALISRTQSEPVSTEQYTDEQKQVIKELFMLMRATWTHKYVSQYTSTDEVRLAMRVWLKAFGHIERELLFTSIERLGQTLTWPPTMEQMAAAVRTLKAERATHPTALPRPAMGKSPVAQRELAKMRRIVGLS